MKKFEAPDVEVVMLTLLDVITSSGDDWEWDGEEGENGTGWH